ncbi:hypothetical protein HPB51_014531 [Rhipicephalus microplus]|uniref:Uncharacterized protein n=1 Tax=Rhipicephalus microplus TaxID=6941 RepID=A0A9J6DND0_RHIMP|nr:hypothetical protein HPB51_014531 [Rhipicephalus microplus]
MQIRRGERSVCRRYVANTPPPFGACSFEPYDLRQQSGLSGAYRQARTYVQEVRRPVSLPEVSEHGLERASGHLVQVEHDGCSSRSPRGASQHSQTAFTAAIGRPTRGRVVKYVGGLSAAAATPSVPFSEQRDAPRLLRRLMLRGVWKELGSRSQAAAATRSPDLSTGRRGASEGSVMPRGSLRAAAGEGARPLPHLLRIQPPSFESSPIELRNPYDGASVREEKGGPNLDDGHDPMGPGGVFGLPY